MASLITVLQRLVVFLDRLVNGTQTGTVGLDFLQIMLRQVALRLKAAADDPLAQGVHGLPISK